jgi:polyhydroxybutyrate depolymerase
MRTNAVGRAGAVVAFALIAAACSDAGPDPCAGKSGTSGTQERTIESGGLQRTFEITAPESALQGRPVPLVLVFHGVLADAQVIQAVTEFPAKAAEEGFITAAGDGVGRSWNAGVCCEPAVSEDVDDVGFTRDMVAAIAAEYCIDPSQIYATGFSNGAAMVFRLACEASDLFAAFAPVGGALALPSCAPAEPRPIEVINNVSDPVVPFPLGESSFAAFLELNDCDATRETAEPASTATCEIAPECAGGATTELCAVRDVGHQWPGGLTNPGNPFRATDSVWDFFSAGAL